MSRESKSEATRRQFLAGSLGSMVISLPVLGANERHSRLAELITATPGLVAYWPLDGDLRDLKGRAHAKLVGGEIQFVAGPAEGRGVLLENGHFLAMDTTPHLDTPATSIELLFKLTRPLARSYNPCLIAKRAGHRETRFSIHVDRQSRNLAIWNGQQVFTFLPQTGPLKVGRWYHLAVTWEGRDLHVYVDGLRCPGSGWFNAKETGLPFQIGSSTEQGTELCDCAVGEVAVYNRVLSAAEVMQRVEAAGFGERVRQMIAERERLTAERRTRDAEARQRLLNDPRLLARGQQRVYRDKFLEAISLPVGGIGSGLIQINGRAELKTWQIFGNFTEARLPHSFFAVSARTQDAPPVVRAVQTAAIGPFSPMQSLSFRGEYPFGWYDFEDDALPVHVSLEVFNPLIPLNAKDSAIPCALFNLTARNPTDRSVEVCFLGVQQNAVGYSGTSPIDGRTFEGYGGNINRVIVTENATILHCSRNTSSRSAADGDMALVAFDAHAVGVAEWDQLSTLHANLVASKPSTGLQEAGPTPDGQTIDGAITVSFSLKPGEERTVPFAFVWHFPNVRHGGRNKWVHAGQMYANWWPNALAIVRYLTKHRERLTRESCLFHDTLYASNLPRWLIDRCISQAAVLTSKTCYWAGDGYFGGWEGCNGTSGCCQGNCGHVWHYAQLHARLFPEIARRMRSEALKAENEAGGIPFRQPTGKVACDGQCGDILGAYREHLCSRDTSWLDRHWPHIKKAMEYVIATWDADEDGVLAGPQHNTLDGELGGNTSWLGSMYLAALAAVENMAEQHGERDLAAHCQRIRKSGAQKQDEALFNGEYYIQIPDPTPRQDYGNGCHIDQLLGEWWSAQVHLEPHYPADHRRSALAALFKHNFRGDFHGVVQLPRKFVDEDDAGLQMICWPNGDRPAQHMRYADEVMSGFEYSAATAMVQNDLLKEGLAVVLATSNRYDGRLRTGLAGAGSGRSAWGYSGNPFGDDECGKFYARPMSIWSMLLALQGFLYDGSAGVIGFQPIWKPEEHVSFFTAAEGWGLFTQKRSGRQQSHQIELRYGTLEIAQLVFSFADGAESAQILVRLGTQRVAAGHSVQDGELHLTLAKPVVVRAGESLRVDIS